MSSRNSTETRRWNAVQTRDASVDGTFVYGVRTTGIYCRPSCPARRPLRENVTFHTTPDEAEAAGYRACQRCRPRAARANEADAQRIAAACRLIEDSEVTPSLQQLAATVRLSPFHFHRLFKRFTGLTPREYAAGHRQQRVREHLRQRTSITDAIVASGYGSSSRFYEHASRLLGMTASAYRDGGRDTRIRFAVGESSIGTILVAATSRGVCAIDLGSDPESLVDSLQQRFAHAELVGGDADFERLVAAIVGHVEKPQTDFALPLDVRGTAFQHRVWQALIRIPPGATATYAEIARVIGQPSAVRAVAHACASNPTAIAIPCHRVIRTDQSLSGYRWGVERKRALLTRERAAVSTAASE